MTDREDDRRPYDNGRLDRQVTRVSAVLRRARLLGQLGRHLAVALVLAALLAFLLRFFLQLPREQAAWSFLLLVPAFGTGWWSARRGYVSRSFVTAWLDLRHGASGRIVTQAETGGEGWRDATEGLLESDPELPRLRLRRVLGAPVPAALFAAVALWIEPSIALPGLHTNVHRAALERVQEKLDALEETVDLDEEFAAEVRERLQRLQEEADEARPESTFEAADRLEQQLQQEAERVQESIEAAQDSLARDGFEEAGEDGDTNSGSALEETLQELTEAGLTQGLAELLQDRTVGAELASLPAFSPEQMAQLAEGLDGTELSKLLGQLSPEQLAQLDQALAELLDGKLGQLVKAGLIDPSSLKPITEFQIHECDENCQSGGT